jgi:hypothetical protein
LDYFGGLAKEFSFVEPSLLLVGANATLYPKDSLELVEELRKGKSKSIYQLASSKQVACPNKVIRV